MDPPIMCFPTRPLLQWYNCGLSPSLVTPQSIPFLAQIPTFSNSSVDSSWRQGSYLSLNWEKFVAIRTVTLLGTGSSYGGMLMQNLWFCNHLVWTNYQVYFFFNLLLTCVMSGCDWKSSLKRSTNYNEIHNFSSWTALRLKEPCNCTGGEFV